MPAVDLHLHSTRSDGTLTPTELVRVCADADLKVVALTDHDSTEGVDEARQAAQQIADGGGGAIEVIPGVELSCDSELGEVHVLGLFVDTGDPEFQAFCARTRRGRLERGRRMVERLAEAGVDLSFERVLAMADGGSVGRPHVARALVEAGFVSHTKEAFDRYLVTGGPGYVARSRLTPVGAVAILVRNGALPVLAHPLVSAVKSGRKAVGRLEETLTALKAAGLVGVEVYYGDYTPDQVRHLEQIARTADLIPCGGSDFHGSGTPGEPRPGSAGPPLDTVERLRAMRRIRDVGATKS